MLKTLAILASAGSLLLPSPPAAHATAAPLSAPDTYAATSDYAAFPGDDFLSTRQARAAVEPRIETYERERPVAPGVTFRSFDRYGPDGFTGTPTWLQGDSLTVDLTKGTTVDYLFPGQVAKGEPLSTQATRAGAVAAVNGDFFDINNSTAPLGVGVQSGNVVQSPEASPTWHKSAAIFTPDGVGGIGQVFFEGSVKLPTGTKTLDGVNKSALKAGGIEAFTPLWGTYCRCRATQGATAVTEVEVTNNTVTAIRDQAGEGPIPANTLMLVGRDAAAAELKTLQPGDQVNIDYQVRTEAGQRIHAAINGRQLLVVNGVAQKARTEDNVPAAPRTAIGFSQDGRKMFLLTADGRQPSFATGLGLDELATMMVEMGAYHALNLDGGGSTTILAREPGTGPQVENRPSDGGERNVPNGLALFAPQGSGRLKGFWVETTLDPNRAPGSSNVALANPERVFPGLTRTLTAAGYDETYGPAPSQPRWRADGYHGTVDRNGVFHGKNAGATKVSVSDHSARGSLDLTVLSRLSTVAPSTQQVALANQSETGRFGVVGADRDGNRAPIEPVDVTLSYDRNVIDIVPNADGQYTITPKQPSGAALVTIDVGGVRSVLPVTIGLTEVTLADFTDPAGWTFFGERATGAVAPTPDGHDGPGLRLSYDFTQSTGTRTGGAVAPAGVTIPGQPRAFRVWVHAQGQGEWASLQVWDGNGTLLPAFRAGFLTYTGWRQLEFIVPPGTAYPLTLRRFYAAETVASKSYQGELIIDGLSVMMPPSLDIPPQPVVRDPIVVQDGTVDGTPWRFAVMSDAQFVARDPDSDIVRNARRTLREIRAAKPDFLIINGDLVDEASPADFALANRILDEELQGELKYYYVPGNHERTNNSLDNFRAAFGETQQVIDHRGIRFITMDTSAINLRGSDWTQLGRLRSELDRAAQDRRVRSVVLVEHVPPRDPTPAKASELSDRKEATTIETWLAAFEKRSGKSAAILGAHVGTFHASRIDGVPLFINGNSGKNPSTQPADGGFTGWSLWGVDRKGDLIAEVRPHVETLSLTAPQALPVGQSTVVSGSVKQANRTVPVAYPVSADWSASPNVHIGSRDGLRRWHAAIFDPSTGTLTALRPATITLAVSVNGVTKRSTIELIAAASTGTGG